MHCAISVSLATDYVKYSQVEALTCTVQSMMRIKVRIAPLCRHQQNLALNRSETDWGHKEVIRSHKGPTAAFLC